MPFLDWVNKSQALRAVADVPYHLLQFESAHGDTAAENLLIQGDNLLALKALLPFYRGQVKCIYADPPFNTEQAFPDYDDKLEHSQWLSMMYPLLQMQRDLLSTLMPATCAPSAVSLCKSSRNLHACSVQPGVSSLG